MNETLVVSGRGQITLPADLRKRLGIKGGDVVILEDRGNEVVLKPAMVVEYQQYSDSEIEEWDRADVIVPVAKTNPDRSFATKPNISLCF